MTTPVPTLQPADARRYLPVLLLLFAGSGCSALIYEIVWYQLLQLVIGSSAISLGVLLATFMGGLCLGSLALPRLLAARKQHPLRVYAKVEFGIAVCGLLVLLGMPLVDGIYAEAVGHGMPAILLRALVCGLCLIPPTFLMGASLPAAARWIETSPEGVSWMGFLYGGNTVGAVFGCLLAGFYLLREFDMTTTTFVAAALNVVVGLGSLAIAAAHAGAGLGAARRRCRAGRQGLLAGVRGHRHFGRVRAGRGSDLDAPAGPHAGGHGVHVFDHPGGIPDRDRAGQRIRRRCWPARRSRGWPSAAASWRWWGPSDGPPSCWRIPCPTGR